MYASSSSGSVHSIAPSFVEAQTLESHRTDGPPVYRRADVPAAEISPMGQQEIRRAWEKMSAHARGAGLIGQDAKNLMQDYFDKKIQYDRSSRPSTIRQSMESWHEVTGFSERSQQSAYDVAQSFSRYGMSTELEAIFLLLKANVRKPESSFVRSLKAHYDCHINSDTARILHRAANDYITAGGKIAQVKKGQALDFFDLLMKKYVSDPTERDGLKVLLTQEPGYMCRQADDNAPTLLHDPAATVFSQDAQASLLEVPEQSSSGLKRTYSAAQIGPEEEERLQSPDLSHREAQPFTRLANPNHDASSGGAGSPSSWPRRDPRQGPIVAEVPQCTVLSSSEPSAGSFDARSLHLNTYGDSAVLPNAATQQPPWMTTSTARTDVDGLGQTGSQTPVHIVLRNLQDVGDFLGLFDMNGSLPNLRPEDVASYLATQPSASSGSDVSGAAQDASAPWNANRQSS